MLDLDFERIYPISKNAPSLTYNEASARILTMVLSDSFAPGRDDDSSASTTNANDDPNPLLQQQQFAFVNASSAASM